MNLDAATIPNKTNTDSSKTIKLSRKALLPREAKLILGVLDECIHQMKTASLLPTLLNSPEALSPSLEEEVVKALKEHQKLEEKYQSIALDGSPDQNELQEEKAKSAKSVQDSFRKIIRMLRATPTTKVVLKRMETNTTGEMGFQKIRNGLCELREVVLERLLTTPAEERERRDMVLEVSQRHSANQKLIDSLEKEVAAANKNKDAEVRSKKHHPTSPTMSFFLILFVTHSYSDLHIE